MNTAFFRYALEVERASSISQAAERLFISQSTLSKAIRELESTLGYDIFERSSHGVVTTEAGTRFLRSARRIVSELDGLAETKECLNQRGVIRLAVPSSCYLLQGIGEFAANAGDMCPDLVITETGGRDAINSVAEGLADIGVARYSPDRESWFSTAVRERGLKAEVLWEHDAVRLWDEALSGATLSTEIIVDDPQSPWWGEDFLGGLPRSKGIRITVTDRHSAIILLHTLKGSYMLTMPWPKERLQAMRLNQCSQGGFKQKDVIILRQEHTITAWERKLIDSMYTVRNRIAFD